MAMTYEEAMKKFPDWGWAFNIPDVAEILQRNPDDESFDPGPEIMRTKWYRETQASTRQWEALNQTDPASANARRQEKEAQIWDKRQQLGVNPDPNWVRDTANKALQFGWSDDQVNDYMTNILSYNPDVQNTAGSLSSTMAALKAEANKYMIKLSDNTAFDYAKSILAGEHKPEDWTSIWQNQAKQQFQYAPEIVNAIGKGISPQQFTDPIKERIGDTLEINPQSIDLTSPKWASILDYTDGKGARRMMTYSEVDSLARSQPEYRETKKARQGAASLAETIMQKFGKVAV